MIPYRVALAVADLIDAQAPETGEAVDRRVALGHHPGDDPPDGPPGDAHQLHTRGLADLGGQPGVLTGIEAGRPPLTDSHRCRAPLTRVHRDDQSAVLEPTTHGKVRRATKASTLKPSLAVPEQLHQLCFAQPGHLPVV
jgi:hypothetical protein